MATLEDRLAKAKATAKELEKRCRQKESATKKQERKRRDHLLYCIAGELTKGKTIDELEAILAKAKNGEVSLGGVDELAMAARAFVMSNNPNVTVQQVKLWTVQIKKKRQAEATKTAVPAQTPQAGEPVRKAALAIGQVEAVAGGQAPR